MATLREYDHLCRTQSPAEFAANLPGGFLVYNREQGMLAAVDAKAGMTLARPLVSIAGGGAMTLADMFDVFRVPAAAGRALSIGCGETNDILINDESISRVHAWLWPVAGGLQVQDAGSTLGTQANGKTLSGQEQVVVAPGKKLTLGNVELIFLTPERFHLFVRQMIP